MSAAESLKKATSHPKTKMRQAVESVNADTDVGPQTHTLSRHLDGREIPTGLSWGHLVELVRDNDPEQLLRKHMNAHLSSKKGRVLKDSWTYHLEAGRINRAQAKALKLIYDTMIMVARDVSVTGFKAERVDGGRNPADWSEHQVMLYRLLRRWESNCDRSNANTYSYRLVKAVAFGDDRRDCCKQAKMNQNNFLTVLTDTLDLYNNLYEEFIG